MRRTFAGLAITAFVVALSAPAFAATETVKGQVVDMGCYKADKSNTGVDHKMPKGDTKDCALGCAKAGCSGADSMSRTPPHSRNPSCPAWNRNWSPSTSR